MPQTTIWEIYVQRAALACRDALPAELPEVQKDELNAIFSRQIREQMGVLLSVKK